MTDMGSGVPPSRISRDTARMDDLPLIPIDAGLSSQEAQARLGQHGPNALETEHPRTV